jgi:threonine 3-dehydrogenase
MTEGFDIGLEMSGSPDALHAMVAGMAHGGRIAVLGLPSEEFALDWSTVITNMLTLRGVYGREMYETWYQMTVLLQSGPTYPGHHPPVMFRDHDEAFATAGSGQSGKIVMSWETHEHAGRGARGDLAACARRV